MAPAAIDRSRNSVGSTDNRKFASQRTSRTPQAQITQMNEHRQQTARRSLNKKDRQIE